VTVQPSTATPGAYTVESIRVPNETDGANTTRVDVRFPAGFASVSYQRVPGWRVTLRKTKLATPIKTADGEITEQVSQVSFIGDGKDGRIPPGGFQDFPLSVRVPGKAGQKLTFKAIQTYDDGKVVRWIGAPGSDQPAPQVTLVAAPDAASAPGATGGTTTTASASDPSGTSSSAASGDGGGDGNGLAIAALVVGGLGVLLGAAGVATGRRRATT
jgi:uncharacterized protein